MGQLGVAIIGCGLIGRKRAQALGDTRLVACADVAIERAQGLAALAPGATSGTDWQAVLGREDVHIVIVSTTNDSLAQITQQAVRDLATAAIGLVSLGLLLRFKIPEPLLVLLAAIAGVAIHR